MLQKVKRFLARVLPVPARTFHRSVQEHAKDMKELSAALNGVKKSVADIEKVACGILWREVINNNIGDRFKPRDYVLLQKLVQFSTISPQKDWTYDFCKSVSSRDYIPALIAWYYQATGMYLNLDSPQTFNEKIQWLKLYDSTPLKTRLADKYLVRDWVAEKIGSQYLIPLLGAWDKFDDIDFDSLPNRFVLKANHGCGWNIIVTDKSNLDIKGANSKLDIWMGKKFGVRGLELHYFNITPKIIAEQFLDGGDDLKDYKFLCFGGEVKYVWVDSSRYTDHRRDVFDLRWNHQPFTIKFPNADSTPPRPNNLEKMIELARILCQGFAHVRVDFYDVNNVIYFGEMTFTSGNGEENIEPIEFNYKMGEWIKLPEPTVFQFV